MFLSKVFLFFTCLHNFSELLTGELAHNRDESVSTRGGSCMGANGMGLQSHVEDLMTDRAESERSSFAKIAFLVSTLNWILNGISALPTCLSINLAPLLLSEDLKYHRLSNGS